MKKALGGERCRVEIILRIANKEVRNMNRLTQVDSKLGNLYVDGKGKGCFENVSSDCKYVLALRKLAEYEEAEEQGRLIISADK